MLTFHPNGTGAGERPTAETVWIDLLNPTDSETRVIEDHTGIRIPTIDELSEIERSSRLFVDDRMLRLSAPVVINPDTDRPSLSPLGMILTPKLLITVRFEQLKAFADAAERGCPEGRPAASAFTALLEALVDREADLLEGARAHLDEISMRVFHTPTSELRAAVRANEDLRALLRRLGRIGERVSIIRESLLAVGRAAAFAKETAGGWLDAEFKTRLAAVSQDVDSLNQFDEHLSGKVQFLLDAVLGLINIAQNDIFKVLTVASVVGIFPTLVAGWYGMNFHNMPEYNWAFGYQYGIGVIAASTILPLAWFKWRGWF
jgi:magnesium transporter